MVDLRQHLLLIDSTAQPAGVCAACGQPVGAGEGLTVLDRGRVLRFRCSGCLASFRSEPGRYVAVRDYCCSPDTCEDPVGGQPVGDTIGGGGHGGLSTGR